MPYPKRRLVTALLALSLGAAMAGCSSGSGGTVATVNGEPISRADFENRLESGPQAKQILSQMIQTKLLDQYATENHIDVSDADIAKKEADIKAKYPPGQFEALLKQQNLTEDDVHKILKEQIVLQRAVDKDVKVSDADISAYFAKNHAQFDKPEQAHAQHILVADLKTADLVESKLKAGAKFADMAKQYSTDPGTKDKGGDLGFFGKGQMVPAFQDAAFSQPLNVVGPPVKSPFGYHIIEVLERKPATKATLASTHDQISDLLKQQQENLAIPAFLQGLKSKAKIDISDDKLKDAIPPTAPAPSST